jgi:peptide/nickel transport system permease protein
VTRIAGVCLRRLVQAIPVLLGVSLLIIAAARLIPGSPGQAYYGEKGTPEKIRELNDSVGWYDPVPVQWARYMGGAVQGDLGRSFVTRQSVVQELGQRATATAELALAAMLLAVPLGLGFGVISALSRRWPFSLLDWGLTAIALIGISMPVFWLGLLLQIHVYPTQGRIAPHLLIEVRTGLYTIDALLMGDARILTDVLRRLALPALALATIPLAVITRMTRSAMLEVLGSEFVRTARAKGAGPVRVAIRHALRNALVPIVTIVGLQLAGLLGGAVLTETVFQWPGLGTYIVAAAEAKDLPALQGAVLLVAAIFVLINLLVDMLYTGLDPRLGQAGSRA